MKIRNGFISNSSSSSFVVLLRNYWEAPVDGEFKFLIDSDTINKLLDYGFRYGQTTSPMTVECGGDGLTEDSSVAASLCYSVICNEYEPIEFLLANGIAFKAVCHYGQEYLEYDGKNRVVLAFNFGEQISMYGFEEGKELTTKSSRVLTKKEYLNENP